VDGFKGGTFRIHSGPASKNADAFVLAGLAQADGMTQSQLEIMVNGKESIPAPDFADLTFFSGVARAVQHRCPLDSLRSGYNEIRIRQPPGQPEQRIVWVELRITPRSVVHPD